MLQFIFRLTCLDIDFFFLLVLWPREYDPAYLRLFVVVDL